jgi:hypothetical protein
MAKAAKSRAARPARARSSSTRGRAPTGKGFPFSKVAHCRIHPGIGIARLGNSLGNEIPENCFIGPETPLHSATPEGGYKDAEGRVKRQAARFRIYAYDKNWNNLGELPINTVTKDKRRPGGASAADVDWTVHLANKKGAWYEFIVRDGRPGKLRNPDIQGDEKPDQRNELIIDPGARSISGAGESQNTFFDSGEFRGTKVPLGEIMTDRDGRLLVLGGRGTSASVISNNPIGGSSSRSNYWSDNDNWYDDISDGKVSAVVTLPNRKKIDIADPRDTAWVVVAPPKFAPGVYPIVTLWDVIRDVKVRRSAKNHIGEIERGVDYFRHVYPILMRATDTAWVNAESRRGHGHGKPGNFDKWRSGHEIPELKEAQPIFDRLRKPKSLADPPTLKRQASPRFMPQLSGDFGDTAIGKPETWFSLLKWQYEKFEQWIDEGCPKSKEGKEEFTALETAPPDRQVEWLQRAALEPCVGGPFFPGIEMTYYAAEPEWYADAFRINWRKHHPGDVTRNMALPWQADFSDCNTNWWPSQRPDDVVAQDVFEEADASWRPRPGEANRRKNPDQQPVTEALLDRVKWDRGLGVATLFRHPWQNPLPDPNKPAPGHEPALPDESNDDKARRSCDDMVRFWHELGFVRPVKTSSSEIAHVEMERRPYAGLPIRDLFHALLNIETHQDALPKVREYVDMVLAAGRSLQQSPEAYASLDNLRPFEYSEDVFAARMNEIYDDTIPGTYDPSKDPIFKTRDNVIERIRQLTPFNLLDGSWLRNIHHLGCVDEVNATLFSILKEELGDGIPSQNHPNIYRDLCHSVGLYPPPIASKAFSDDPDYLDAGFESPAFQLGISQFSKKYYPELIGMTLYLEWTVLTLHRAETLLNYFKFNTQFYRMHIAIDNAANGHGARIRRAVQLYLQQVAADGGSVQEQWQRIWDGYVAFGYMFNALIWQIKYHIKNPPTLQQRMVRLIQRKSEFGKYNHGDKKLGAHAINDLFAEPQKLLQELVRTKKLVPGKPEESPFFRLLEFEGGPMYHVFSDEEIDLWRQWTVQLAHPDDAHARAAETTPHHPDAHYARLRDAGHLRPFTGLVSEHRLQHWCCLATAGDDGAATTPAPAKRGRDGAAAVPAAALRALDARFDKWLAWGMVRVVVHLANRYAGSPAIAGCKIATAHPASGERRTVADWLEAVRNAENPAIEASTFLEALQGGRSAAAKGLMAEIRKKDAALGRVFQAQIPGNDGTRAVDTMEAWIGRDAPLPEVGRRRVKPLGLETTLDEEEHHPFGVAIGFGRIS